MWVVWVVGGFLAWLVLGILVALVLGKSIRLADERSLAAGHSRELIATELSGLAPAASPGDDVAARSAAGRPRSSAAVRPKRRPVPLPPVGVALAAIAVALEAAGCALRLSGAHGETAWLLSMDAPLSLPRMFVTALFAASAVAALAAAGRSAGRRAWWASVGAVAAAISFVKAGGTIHAVAIHRLSGAIGAAGALAISALVAAAVVGTLWYLARGERRDRLRVLGSLALYAVAAVGLSSISTSVGGGGAATVATFVEESGEALAGVAFLIAVLVGVAPRLVLPADWVLRRSGDAPTWETDEVVALRPSARPR